MGSRYRMEISTMTESLTWFWFPPVPIRQSFTKGTEKGIFIFGDASYKPKAHFNRLVNTLLVFGVFCLLGLITRELLFALEKPHSFSLADCKVPQQLTNITPVMLSRNESLLATSTSVFAIHSIERFQFSYSDFLIRSQGCIGNDIFTHLSYK